MRTEILAPLAIVFARPEYAMLAEEFARLMHAFGQGIDTRLRRDIARLAAAIERIDRCVDSAPNDAERRIRWQVTIAGLDSQPRRGTKGLSAEGHEELADAVADLHALAAERGVLHRTRRIVAKEARTSEAIRATCSGRSFLRAVEREGRLTAALALVIAGDACSAAFRRFFFRLGAPANIVDKILDVKGDHTRGEMALSPSAPLYARLFVALVYRGVALAVSCWRPIFVLRLGLRYLLGEPS